MRDQPSRTDLRLAELIAALSLAIDLGLGQPLEQFLRACLLAMRLGEDLGLADTELTEVYYLALLRYAGCTAEAHTAAAVFGDDVAANSWLLTADHGRPAEMLGGVIRNVGHGERGPRRARRVVRALSAIPMKAKPVTVAHCEAGQLMARQLGVGASMQHLLGQVYERWDGRGLPRGLRGEAVAPVVRVVQLAYDAAVFHRLGGPEVAVAILRQRAGGAHDPRLVEHFGRHAGRLLAGLETDATWEGVLAAEPGPRPRLTAEQLDGALAALGDFSDLKSPFIVGHSRAVATLASAAARACGLPETDVVILRRAGLVHDLGRVGISSGIWEKPGPLTGDEWERVRLHPYLTERVLARARGLAALGGLAALHHERLDGSGYHRGLPASLQPPPARLLAAADVYQALTEARPHRPARTPEAAASELRREVGAGRLDGEAIDAVLVAAGHRLRRRRRDWVAGLSDREVEVLRLIARGLSNRQMAGRLSISERTVHHHVEHIYDKLGISTRAAATLFAMQHNLLGDASDEKMG